MNQQSTSNSVKRFPRTLLEAFPHDCDPDVISHPMLADPPAGLRFEEKLAQLALKAVRRATSAARQAITAIAGH